MWGWDRVVRQVLWLCTQAKSLRGCKVSDMLSRLGQDRAAQSQGWDKNHSTK